jgi:hypothetical protein
MAPDLLPVSTRGADLAQGPEASSEIGQRHAPAGDLQCLQALSGILREALDHLVEGGRVEHRRGQCAGGLMRGTGGRVEAPGFGQDAQVAEVVVLERSQERQHVEGRPEDPRR